MENKRGGSFHLLIGSAGYARPSVKLLQGNGQWTHGRSPHTQPSALGCGGQTTAAGGSGRRVNARVPPSNASAGSECLIVHKDSYTRRCSTWVHRTGRGKKNNPQSHFVFRPLAGHKTPLLRLLFFLNSDGSDCNAAGMMCITLLNLNSSGAKVHDSCYALCYVMSNNVCL